MNNLRQFIAILKSRKGLVEISAPVNLDLELAEIHRRVIAAGGPALLFTRAHQNGKESIFPVVSNLFGAQERIELAFGPRPERVIQDLAKLAQKAPSIKNLWKARKTLIHLRTMGAKLRKRNRKAAGFSGIGLEAIPFTKSWKEDGGFFATLPLVYTEHPITGSHNLGMYRMQRHNDTETGMHWQINKGGGFHYYEAEKMAKSLPVAVFFGGPPALLLSAIAPLPENVGELLLAGFLLGKKIEISKIKDFVYPLIYDSEFTLLGEVSAGRRKAEGPFGDHYGYYSLQHPYPVFQVRKILFRKNAIFPVTVVGKPKQEDFYLGDYLQKLLAPIFPLVLPSVKSLWSYGETGYHSLSACIVRERYPREAMSSAFAILGQGQLSLTKFLLVLDQEMDLKDFLPVWQHILERADFSRDLFIFDHLSMDTLDYTGPEINKGSKAILAGLGKPVRKLARKLEKMPPWVTQARIFSPGCLVISTGKNFSKEKLQPTQMVKDPLLKVWTIIILADNAALCTKTVSSFLWTVFTRFEPAADIHSVQTKINRNTITFNAPLLFDCRMKPPYPDELFCDAKTASLVDQRWKEYFPQGMEMGDSDRAHLDKP